MNLAFSFRRPPLVQSLVFAGTLRPDCRKPGLATRLQWVCIALAAALRRPFTRSVHPNEIDLRLPRL